MCGIALIIGPSPDTAVFDQMLEAIAPRGDVREAVTGDRHCLGTQRLKIVDRERAIQPWISPDGRWAVCYNGEVYNFRSLRSELTGLGHQLRSDSDTEVILEAFAEWGEQAVHRLRGEFAFAVVDRAADQVYLARDPLGVKPLYWSRCGGHLYVASELKALVPSGGLVSEIPPGHHGWGNPAQDPAVTAYVDLLTMGDGDELITDTGEAARLVRAALEDSIRVRLDTDLTVGVILSGGLDSTLTLLHVRDMHPDCVAFTIGTPGSDDVSYARRVTRELGVEHDHDDRDVNRMLADLGYTIAGPWRFVQVHASWRRPPGNPQIRWPDEVQMPQARLYPAVQRICLDVAGAAAVVPWRSGFLLLLPAAPDNLARDLDVAADLLDRVHAAAGQVGPGARVHLAISSPVRTARELGHGLHEADQALELARRLGIADRPLAFEHLGVYRILLDGGGSQHRRDFVEDALGPLARYDAERGTQLVPTLRAYVQADYNANQTARQLYVHANTLAYRLRTIRRLLGGDPARGDLRLTVELALKLNDLPRLSG